MSSEWMKVMLEEIARKKAQQAEERAEASARARIEPAAQDDRRRSAEGPAKSDEPPGRPAPARDTAR